jgi:hypothetical protein
MRDRRCAYYFRKASTLDVPGAVPPIRALVAHCALAKTMLKRLCTDPNGRSLADCLEVPKPAGGKRLVCGPDMRVIESVACTEERCQQSCWQAFESTLKAFGLSAALSPVEVAFGDAGDYAQDALDRRLSDQEEGWKA